MRDRSVQDGVVVNFVKFKRSLTRSRNGFRETVTVNCKFYVTAILATEHRTFMKPLNGRKSSERLPFVLPAPGASHITRAIGFAGGAAAGGKLAAVNSSHRLRD